MALYVSWQGNVPVLSEEKSSHSSRFTPVFYSELKKFLCPGLCGASEDEKIYLWAQNYAYYLDGRRVCSWREGEATEISGDLMDTILRSGVPQADVVEKNREILGRLESEAISLIQQTAETYSLPIEVGYSGGKDSEVVLDLVRRALPADRYKVIFNDTRQELPTTYARVRELVSAGVDIRVIDSGVDPVEMWRKMGPPNMNFRYCCRVYKFNSPGEGLSVCGVRASESVARGKYEKIKAGAKYSAKIQFYPILDWPDLAVWLYIMAHKIPVNRAYREGLRRVGCSCCPCSSEKTDARVDSIFPGLRTPFLEVIHSVVSTTEWKKSFGSTKRLVLPFSVERSDKGNAYSFDPRTEPQKEWVKILETPIDINASDGRIFVPAGGEAGRYSVVERALACICCGACAHECPTGALTIDYATQRVSVNANICCHCKACIKRQCSVVRNLSKKVTLQDLLEDEN